jgi:hypothetical protein
MLFRTTRPLMPISGLRNGKVLTVSTPERSLQGANEAALPLPQGCAAVRHPVTTANAFPEAGDFGGGLLSGPALAFV